MRFHKAVEITAPEAAALIESNRGASGRAAVISFESTWYDVRALSTAELECFIDDLARRGYASGSGSLN
jgi:hypothetical protein